MKRAALTLLAAAFAITLAPGPWGDERVSDLYVYRQYAALFLDGYLPYRDVSFEYPPLAAPVIALPGLAGTGEEAYRLAFAGVALALLSAVVLAVGALAARTGADRRTAMVAAALTPLLAGAMIRTHFDLAPVALTLAALLLLCAARPRAGFVVLGLGVMTKGFPLVVAPVALAWLAGRGERRAALEGAGTLALTIGAIGAACLVLSPSGAAGAVSYHLERPLQVESTAASIVQALDAAGAGEAEAVSSHRSDGLTHPIDDPLTALLGALLAGVVVAAAVACARRPQTRALVLGSLAATVAFAALGKVLSPQFLIWALPLAALALAWRMYALAALTLGATCLTLIEFPAHYADVVAREPLATGLVAARNALLLAAVTLSIRCLTAIPAADPAAAAARSPWRARPRRPRPAPR
ncbi:MAG: glycosyltransferase 87 family protein [Actinomycetota bacterium]|nr:glycosyltransferase 87 family protein [Actinomycetota bacterium]